MIRTIIWVHWRRWWHNPPEVCLTFLVPLVFFTIFALILGDRNRLDSKTRISIAWCDELNSDLSRATLRILQTSETLEVVTESQPGQISHNRRRAMQLVRDGKVSLAVLLTSADGAKARGEPDAPEFQVLPTAKLLTDSYDKVSPRIVTAALQHAFIQALDTIAQERRSTPSDRTGLVVTAAVEWSKQHLPESTRIPDLEIIDLLGKRQSNPVVAMYAAGIAVMFLLFSTTAASGSLLDELENNTLDRILASRMTMDDLLMGKWFFLTTLGVAQMSMMFLWAQLVFHVQVWAHLGAVAIMTVVTAGAASSLALFLATLCKSRNQLSWISVVVVLSMSALGGSMVPRYLMSERMLQIGQFTFNAWALDGFNKIFWRELPLAAMRNELFILLTTACGLLIMARLAASRWDRCRRS